MGDETTTTHCPECSGRLRTEQTETICEQCGLVYAEATIDYGPEWRSFGDTTEQRRRTGAPLTRSRHDRGLSTEIGYGTSARLTGRKRRQLARMRREHNRARISTKADQNRVYGFTEIRRLTTTLSLPVSVREQACVLFKSAQSADLLRGRSLEGFAAAAVYETCRSRSIARTIDEVVTTARASERELKAAYDALNRELGLPVGPIAPVEYLPRYASKLGVETVVEQRAHEYATSLQQQNRIGGRNPSGVAAGCLYTAARDLPGCEAITQTAAAAVANVSTVTVRGTYKLIERYCVNERQQKGPVCATNETD